MRFTVLVTWFLDRPVSGGYIFVAVASIVVGFAGCGWNGRMFISARFGSCGAAIDQDGSKRLGVYFIVDTVYNRLLYNVFRKF
jgi:hypothetical protein